VNGKKHMPHDKRIEDFLRNVESAPLSVLLLDYDGTLAPFSINRERALPYNGVVELLQKIIETGRTRLGIVTGRDAHEVGPLLGLHPPIEVWGAHGFQRLRPDGICEMPEIPEAAAQSLDNARQWLDYQGLLKLAEIKPGSIAVHWRALDEAAAFKLRSRILLGWSHMADHSALKLLEFDGGVELCLPELDKGNAVRTILGEVDPEVPVAYLGDDATDERAFEALGHRGLSVLVRPRPRRTSAQVWLKAPEELLEFLSRWKKATEATSKAYSASRSW
jgi:trehalose 6-phosphate phosphatase